MSRLASFVRRPAVVIVAVGLLAGGLRFWHLSSPNERIFDEVYYPKAGCILVGGTNAQCGVTSSAERYWRTNKWDVGSWTHPPLGKWMIGLGEKAFGFDAFGWRVASATVGTLTVVIVALLAYLMFGSALWAGLAGLLMSVEGLSFVMSRTGLLDSFTAFWITAGFLFLVLDRRWIERRTEPPGEPPEGQDRGRTAAAEAGPVAGLAPLALRGRRGVRRLDRDEVVGRHGARRRRTPGVRMGGRTPTPCGGRTHPARGRANDHAGDLRIGARLPGRAGRRLPGHLPPLVPPLRLEHGGVVDNQAQIWDYHKTLQWFRTDPKTGDVTPTHPWLSHAWWWLPMQRPVLFFARYPTDGTRWITALGNPAVFWVSFWTLPYTAWAWWRRHDWRASLILVAFSLQYFPWFFISRPQFFFYMTPIVPFLVLAAVYTARDLSDMRIEQHDPQTGEVVERSTLFPYRPFVWGYVALAVALFVFFYPVLTGERLSKTAFTLRVWMRSWT